MEPLTLKVSESVFEDASSTLFIDTIDCIDHLLTDLIACDDLFNKKMHYRNEVGNAKTVIRDIYSNELGLKNKITEVGKPEQDTNSIANSCEYISMVDERNPATKNAILHSKLLKNKIFDVKKLAEIIKHDQPVKICVEKFVRDCETIEQTINGDKEEENTAVNKLPELNPEKIKRFLRSCKNFKNELAQYKENMNRNIKYGIDSKTNLIHHICTVIDLSKNSNVKFKSDRLTQFIKVCEETIKYLQQYRKVESIPRKVEEVRYLKRVKRKRKKALPLATSHRPLPGECDYCGEIHSEEKNDRDTDSVKPCKECCTAPPLEEEQQDEEEPEPVNILATKVHKITRVTRFLKPDGTVQENKEVTTFKEIHHDPPEVDDLSMFQELNEDDYEIIEERIEDISSDGVSTIRSRDNATDDDRLEKKDNNVQTMLDNQDEHYLTFEGEDERNSDEGILRLNTRGVDVKSGPSMISVTPDGSHVRLAFIKQGIPKSEEVDLQISSSTMDLLRKRDLGNLIFEIKKRDKSRFGAGRISGRGILRNPTYQTSIIKSEKYHTPRTEEVDAERANVCSMMYEKYDSPTSDYNLSSRSSMMGFKKQDDSRSNSDLLSDRSSTNMYNRRDNSIKRGVPDGRAEHGGIHRSSGSNKSYSRGSLIRIRRDKSNNVDVNSGPSTCNLSLVRNKDHNHLLLEDRKRTEEEIADPRPPARNSEMDNLLFRIRQWEKHKSDHVIQDFTMIHPTLRGCISANIHDLMSQNNY